MRRKRSIGAWVIVAVISMVALGAPPFAAAEETGGTIGPGAHSVSWTGEFRQPPICPTGSAGQVTCHDDFLLEVAVPEGYWNAHRSDGKVTVEISWDSPANDYELHVYPDPQDPQCPECGPELAEENFVRGATSEQARIPDASGSYVIRVVHRMSVTPNQDGSAFRGIATFPSAAPIAVFDDSRLSFAPATIASAHFLGAEPQIAMERRVTRRAGLSSSSAAIDPQRIFMDWPLTTSPQIG